MFVFNLLPGFRPELCFNEKPVPSSQWPLRKNTSLPVFMEHFWQFTKSLAFSGLSSQLLVCGLLMVLSTVLVSIVRGKICLWAYILISGPKLERKAGACGFELCQKGCNLSVTVGEAKFSSTAAVLGNGGSNVMSKFEQDA